MCAHFMIQSTPVCNHCTVANVIAVTLTRTAADEWLMLIQ